MFKMLRRWRSRRGNLLPPAHAPSAAPTNATWSPHRCRETSTKKEPGESKEEADDRAIRVAAKWYAERLPAKPIVFLSQDPTSRQRAQDEGLQAMGVMQYAKWLTEQATAAAGAGGATSSGALARLRGCLVC